MEKLRNKMTYGALGAAGGVAGLIGPAGLCAGGACASCLRCAGLGIVLVALAILKKRKGETHHGLVKSSN